jgi:excisionase family DNA binding protein
VTSSASYLTVQEAATLVGLSEQAIRRAIRRGELQAIKVCSRIRILLTDLEAWLEGNRIAAPSTHQVKSKKHGLLRKLRDSDA